VSIVDSTGCNLAHHCVMRGYTVRFTTASAMLNELALQDSSAGLKHYVLLPRSDRRSSHAKTPNAMTPQSSRAWWHDRGAALRVSGRSAGRSGSSPPTMAIDLRGRTGAMPDASAK
jgi:hypothetical protein